MTSRLPPLVQGSFTVPIVVSGAVWSHDSEREKESLSFIQQKERYFCDISLAAVPLLDETKVFCLMYVQEGWQLGNFLIY